MVSQECIMFLDFLLTGRSLCKNHIKEAKIAVFTQNYFVLDDQKSNIQPLFKNNYNNNLGYSQSIKKIVFLR